MKRESRILLAIAGTLGAIGVGFGAFGAHALKEQLVLAGRLDTYETAVLYHMLHTLAIVGAAILFHLKDNVWVKRAGISFTTGIIIFSGSLYVLCFTGITWLGAITPIGGVFFILGWLSVSWAFLRNKP